MITVYSFSTSQQTKKCDWAKELAMMEYCLNIDGPKATHDNSKLSSLWCNGDLPMKDVLTFEQKMSNACFYAMTHVMKCLDANMWYSTDKDTLNNVQNWLKGSQPSKCQDGRKVPYEHKVIETRSYGRHFCSSISIKQTGGDFLHKSLTWLKPTYQSEAFDYYGISSVCVEKLEDILHLESMFGKVPSEMELISTEKEVVDFIEFLKDICETESHYKLYTHQNKHILYILICGIEEQVQRNSNFWNEMKDTFFPNDNRNRAMEEISHYLKMLMKRKDCLEEVHFQEFVRLLLSLDGFCTSGLGSYQLQQFTHNTDNDVDTPECTPSLLYQSLPLSSSTGVVPIQIISPTCSSQWTPLMSTERGFVEDVTVKIAVPLMWQMYEQELAVLVNKDYDVDGHGTIILQGGMAVVNDKVRNIVLCMDTHVFKELKGFSKAKDTISWIRKFAEERQKPWCTLYIESKEYSIWDVIEQGKKIYANFNLCV